MKHKASEPQWIPALKDYRINCLNCGKELSELDIFDECNGRDNSLGVKVSDGIKLRDKFGGK